MDDPRRLPRRGGHPRRGHPPGAAARPHLPARAAGRPDDAAMKRRHHEPMTRLTTFADARGHGRARRRGDRSRAARAPASSAASRTSRCPAARPPRAPTNCSPRRCESWEGVEIWFADERCVGPEDEESNYRMAAETLLRPAGIDPARVHRMEGELGPEEGARRYAEALAHSSAEPSHPSRDLPAQPRARSRSPATPCRCST